MSAYSTFQSCCKWLLEVGKHSLKIVSSYSYLGINISSNGVWDMHNYKEVIR